MTHYPVIDVFGPTVQGEGPAAGARCYFVRLGGCDYRCSWCDTMYAVEPAEVRANSTRMTGLQVADVLSDLEAKFDEIVVVSGGNPALHHGEELMDALASYTVHVETQGTMWRSWLNRTDLVVTSPKPPSAGMDVEAGLDAAAHFWSRLTTSRALKFVAFNDADLAFAVRARERLDPLHAWPAYLSAGTKQEGSLAEQAVSGFGWLAERAIADDALRDFRVGLQLHVLVWPGERAR